jgi:hypothetical protein
MAENLVQAYAAACGGKKPDRLAPSKIAAGQAASRERSAIGVQVVGQGAG